MNRLLAIIKKEFIQMGRDRLTLAMMLLMPFVQLLVFGFAINTDVKHLPMAVLDRSNTEESRLLVQAFTNSGYFSIFEQVDRPSRITHMIDRGDVKVGLIINRDYAKDIHRGLPAKVQVLVDASDPTTASSAFSNAQGIGNMFSYQLLFRRLGNSTAFSPQNLPVKMQVRGWYNPDLKSAIYIVPGIIGVILTMTMMMITSMAIVRERETGTLEQLITTPIKSHELMIGKIVPYIVIGYVQVTIALLVGGVVFKVPIRGSVALLYALASIFIICYLGLGLLISTVAKSQQQAMQMSFFLFLPTILLSGFMFPRAGMPLFAQYIGLVMPLTFFLEIVRGIILKGVGIMMVWHFVWPLIVFMLLILILGIMRFKKRID